MSLAVLLLLIPSLPLVYGVRITPSRAELDFVPNAVADVEFAISGAEKIQVYMDLGDLSPVVTLTDPAPNGSGRTVRVHLTLPKEMKTPGRNVIYLTAKELPVHMNAVGALTVIRVPIYINVPYPGYYATLSFDAPSVNQGETVNFKIIATNLGTNSITNAYAKIEVYEGSMLVNTLTTNSQQIASKSTAEFVAPMSTEGIKAGTYRAVATLYYDGNTVQAERTLNIGTLYVAIKDYTKELEQGKINRFDINVESKWNNQIKNVYAMIIFEGNEIKTPSYDLMPWETKTLSGYLDTANQAFGKHKINITLYYEDKITNEMGEVNLVTQKEPVSKEGLPEKPSAFQLKLTPVTILVGIILILVIVDIFWLFFKSKGNKASASRSSPEKPNSDKGKKKKR